jgi:hypothetical protein
LEDDFRFFSTEPSIQFQSSDARGLGLHTLKTVLGTSPVLSRLAEETSGQCARSNRRGLSAEGGIRMQAADAITEAEQAAERKKQTGANRVDEMAKAVHGAADELAQQLPKAAEFVHAAASRLEEGAGALRRRSAEDLMRTLNDFGRKEPLAIFGGAVIAGFAISRFLKSSADNRQSSADNRR